jgi:excisionase family DNA binding protein
VEGTPPNSPGTGNSVYPKVYTATDLQRALHLSKNTVNGLLRTGRIRSVRAGHKYLVSYNALLEFLGEAR